MGESGREKALTFRGESKNVTSSFLSTALDRIKTLCLLTGRSSLLIITLVTDYG